MHPYLQETEYAVRGLFALIGDEEIQCDAIRAKIDESNGERLRAQAILHQGAPSTGFGEDTTPYFEKKVRDARKSILALETQLLELEASLAAKAFSVRSIAGSILQIAKQGIVVAHGSLANCPVGRTVGTEDLSNVIWQARNQALHWEEGAFRPPVMTCFGKLEATFGARFRLGGMPPANLAKDVLDAIGWRSYPDYFTDMVTILP